jgi:hypothetical protein
MAVLLLTLLLAYSRSMVAAPSAAPPGGFKSYSWDTVQTFCFPGGTGDAGYGGHSGNEQLFSAEQIQLYTKYDLVMIAMINQTALHPATPHDGSFVPQATAMSIKQAAAIKAVRPDVPVFTYITGYLAQSTFEGGAKFAQPQYSDWWLRDTHGAYINDNYTTAHPTNCHCYGYTQSAPGPLWDFRQARVQQYFMDEMVTPMISSPSVDGIFFDDALNIPNYCFTPPHGSASCTGSFTFTAAEQAAAGAATLEHYDKVLAAMASKNKGCVMSMNPVTATSYPINSSQGDGMLLKHRAFHFWEGFGAGDIELALELGAKGQPFLAHFGLKSDDWRKRQYSFAMYLIVASEWSYYGMSAGWTAAAFPWYEEYSKPLGPPTAPAQLLGNGRYFRDFKHLNVSLDTVTETAQVIWKGGITPPVNPPPSPPLPPPPLPAGGCKAWNCSCQGMTDFFGTVGGVGFGCAPAAAREFWKSKHCDTKRASSPCVEPPAAGCGGGPAWPGNATHSSGSCCPGCRRAGSAVY